jgi:Uma2 family endonuclease
MIPAASQFDLFLKANEIGLRLEITGGIPSWETQPVLLHQKAVDVIRESIRRSNQKSKCACVHYADLYITFPDGSLKRPDISIFCREPDETTTAITLIPEAVIEVISQGYEMKDLEINPTFFLSQGVKDVLVLDPMTKFILHARKDGKKTYTSPREFKLECGCVVTV